jgi:hypothetical protein
VAVVISHGRLAANYFQPQASYQNPNLTTVGYSANIIPRVVFDGIWLVGVYCLAMLLGLLAVALQIGATRVHDDGWRDAIELATGPSSAVSLVAIFVFWGLLAHALTSSVANVQFFDRYLIDVVIFVGALTLAFAVARDLLAVGPIRHLWIPAVIGLALIGLVVVDATAATDGAKWALADRAVAMGYRPASIDGGFEWYGFHQTSAVHVRDPGGPVGGGQASWTRMFPQSPICATVEGRRPGHDPSASPPLATRQVTTLVGQRLEFALVTGPDHCSPTRA